MKIPKLALVLLVAVAAATLPAPAAEHADPVLAHVTAATDAHRAALLRGGFDLAETRHGDVYDVVLWPGDRERLTKLGLRFELVEEPPVEPVQASTTAGTRTTYRTLEEHYDDLRALAETYPDRVKLVTAPFETLEEREVLGVEIAANVDRNNGRPTVMIDGTHHAREWPAAEMTTEFAVDLARGYGTDARITALLDKVRVLVVPVVNPDGFAYSRGSPLEASTLGVVAGGQGAYWRKNRRGVAHAAGHSAGSYGVDPNRNYSFYWGGGGPIPYSSTSALPIDQPYQGHAPFSEVESRNVQALALQRNIVTAITNHTYGRLVLWPWGYTTQHPPDHDVLVALGRAIAGANGYNPQPSWMLYPTTGTSKDWMYATLGTLAYTVEAGSSFHPPYSTIKNLYAANKKGFLVAAEAALNNAYHSILSGTVTGSGSGVEASLRLTKTLAHPLSSPGKYVATAPEETIDVRMDTAEDGTFTWHVNPSGRPLVPNEQYLLRVEAPGFAPLQRTVSVARGQHLDLGPLELQPL